MFGLFQSQTQLESFCNELTPNKLARTQSASTDNESRAVPLAMLLLYLAGKFVTDIRNDKHLRKYYKKANADIVIIETILYLHATLSYSLMDEMLEEESLGMLNTALTGALAFVEEKSNITGTQRLSHARNYAPSLKISTERFALNLEHCCFGNAPVLKPSINLNQANLETHLGLKAHTVAFAHAQIPVCTEIVQKIIEGEP